ncbi:MAG: MMPL family transporter, partial [Methylococcaceae bacterium]|nr:MMPL family transporter [Methylococcaceae bacterium]
MSFKSFSRSLLFHWVNWTLSNPFLVLIIIGLLTFSAWQYTVNNLSINTDTTDMIAPDAPFQRNLRNFEKAFSQDVHKISLVIESDTPELTKSATLRLARLLSADKTNFESVYIPNENDFFHQNGLLYLDTNDLQTLSNNLSQAQPFIGRISQEPNLTGFFSIFEDALTSSNKNQELPIDLPSLIDKVSLALHKSMNGENNLLSWETLIAEKKLSGQGSDKGFINVSPRFDFTQIRPAENPIKAIRKAIAEIQQPDLPTVKVWITGEVGLEDDELEGMSSGTFNASIFSIVLVLVILLIAYHASILMTAATLFTLALGMVFCGAFAAFSVKELNLISVAFAVSNIGLGVEYAIHFCLRYRDNLLHHVHRKGAIRSTLISTSPSLILCAGTTAIGLYAFIPTDYKGVSELGLLAGTSLFICLLVTLTVLPALLRFIPVTVESEPPSHHPALATLSEKLATFTLHYAKPISVVACLVAVISVMLVFKVKTDFNPINLRDPNTESVIAFKNLIKDPDT